MAEENQPIDYDKLIGELQMIAKFGDALSGRAFQAIQELLKKVSKLKEKCASLQEMLDEAREEVLRLEKEIDKSVNVGIDPAVNEQPSIDKNTVNNWIEQMMKMALNKNNWNDI